MNKQTAIDLFAGIGGIRLGFEQAFGEENIKTVFVSEWDEHANKTYKANFNDSFDISGDITKICEEDIPSFDICLAGFPCQAFSLAGQRKGFTDDYKGMSRGTLFFDVARICSAHKPKVIFCENVKGLSIHDKGRTYSIIKKTLEEIGYTVHEEILNSKDFGIPQNRERIYIVAFRNDIDSSMFVFPKATDSTKRIRDIIEKTPVNAKYYLSNVYLETLRRHRERHEKRGNGFGYEIRDWNDIAGAIVCGGMGRERNLIIDKRQKNLTPTTHIKGEINSEGIRKMTPREWARLQGFPETFKLELADVHLYKQFGNSVSVPVIKAIAKEIKTVLESHEERKDKIMIKGNKGEWSELYVFLRLLADGKLFAADENLNRINSMFFPIIKIVREELKGKPINYFTGQNIRISTDNEFIEIPKERFSEESEILLQKIMSTKTGTLSSETTENFMDMISVKCLKAGGSNKADIIIQIHDIQTGYESEVGFSIKSKLGSPATLLNASKATNFIYEIVGNKRSLEYIQKNITTIQGVEKPTQDNKTIGVKNILEKFIDLDCKLKFIATDERFHDNLMMTDTLMPHIVAEMLISYYTGKTKNTLKEITKEIIKINPLGLKEDKAATFYTHKIKSFLSSIALGMTPSFEWDGTYDASGGYIIVKTDGDIVAYHIYNLDSFKGYLLNNTRFEAAQRFPSPPPSKKKGFDYGYIYEEGDKLYIKLNLQIRFF